MFKTDGHLVYDGNRRVRALFIIDLRFRAEEYRARGEYHKALECEIQSRG